MSDRPQRIYSNSSAGTKNVKIAQRKISIADGMPFDDLIKNSIANRVIWSADGTIVKVRRNVGGVDKINIETPEIEVEEEVVGVEEKKVSKRLLLSFDVYDPTQNYGPDYDIGPYNYITGAWLAQRVVPSGGISAVNPDALKNSLLQGDRTENVYPWVTADEDSEYGPYEYDRDPETVENSRFEKVELLSNMRWYPQNVGPYYYLLGYSVLQDSGADWTEAQGGFENCFLDYGTTGIDQTVYETPYYEWASPDAYDVYELLSYEECGDCGWQAIEYTATYNVMGCNVACTPAYWETESPFTDCDYTNNGNIILGGSYLDVQWRYWIWEETWTYCSFFCGCCNEDTPRWQNVRYDTLHDVGEYGTPYWDTGWSGGGTITHTAIASANPDPIAIEIGRLTQLGTNLLHHWQCEGKYGYEYFAETSGFEYRTVINSIEGNRLSINGGSFVSYEDQQGSEVKCGMAVYTETVYDECSQSISYFYTTPRTQSTVYGGSVGKRLWLYVEDGGVSAKVIFDEFNISYNSYISLTEHLPTYGANTFNVYKYNGRAVFVYGLTKINTDDDIRYYAGGMIMLKSDGSIRHFSSGWVPCTMLNTSSGYVGLQIAGPSPQKDDVSKPDEFRWDGLCRCLVYKTSSIIEG